MFKISLSLSLSHIIPPTNECVYVGVWREKGGGGGGCMCVFVLFLSFLSEGQYTV